MTNYLDKPLMPLHGAAFIYLDPSIPSLCGAILRNYVDRRSGTQFNRLTSFFFLSSHERCILHQIRPNWCFGGWRSSVTEKGLCAVV